MSQEERYRHVTIRRKKKDISVSVRDANCNRRDCFMPRPSLDSNGEWVCRTREVEGCPVRSLIPLKKND